MDEAIGRRGRAAPSRALALLEPRLSQPASRPRCRAAVDPLVRDRACAFSAQVMGPSRATPHHLGLLHRVRLKIEVLDLLRASGEDERRAPPWCAPAGIEPPAHMIATALLHSWPALTSLARYGLISAALPAMMPTCRLLCALSDRRSLRRWQASARSVIGHDAVACGTCDNGRAGAWVAGRERGWPRGCG